MTRSLAAVFDGTARSVSLRELPTPIPTGEETLVRVLGCTLCGSDLHSFEGRRTVPTPTVLGHEIVGEIVAQGESAPRRDLGGRSLAPGDRVTWAIVASCGACPMCSRGLPQKCLHAVKYGHEAFRPGRELLGGLAEHCLLTPGTALVRLPDGLPLETACPSSCATATVAAALEAAGELAGRTVCLVGAGMLGLTAAALARARGAEAVLCVEPNASRRERALRFGATHAASPDELPAVAAALVGPLGFDAVVELSGHQTAFDAVWPVVRTGGALVLVGSVCPAPPVSIELERVVRRQLTIRGVHNYAPRHLLEAVEFLAEAGDRFPFAELVAGWRPLTDVAAAFEDAAHGGAIRVGVRPTAG